MTPRDKAIKELKLAGYTTLIHGKRHDLYWNEEINQKIPLKRHDFDEDDLRYILKEIRTSQKRWGS